MGQYSDQPDPPVYHQVIETKDCVRYTDPRYAQWFVDRINFVYGDANVRVDETHTIRWFGYYALRVGDWLYSGTTPVTDEVLRASQLRPAGSVWPLEAAPGLAVTSTDFENSTQKEA